MSDQAPDYPLNDRPIESHQEKIELLEVELNLKDASVASECEVNSLQAAQQQHRDQINLLKRTRKNVV